MDKDLQKKIDVLDLEGLYQYLLVSNMVGGVVDIIGVGLMLLVITHFHIMWVLLAIIPIWFLATLGASMGKTRKYIKERMDFLRR